MVPVNPISSLPPRTVDAAKDSSEERQRGERKQQKEDKGKNTSKKAADTAANEKSDNQEVVQVSQPIDSSRLVELLPHETKPRPRIDLYQTKPQSSEDVKEVPVSKKLNKAV